MLIFFGQMDLFYGPSLTAIGPCGPCTRIEVLLHLADESQVDLHAAALILVTYTHTANQKGRSSRGPDAFLGLRRLRRTTTTGRARAGMKPGTWRSLYSFCHSDEDAIFPCSS